MVGMCPVLLMVFLCYSYQQYTPVDHSRYVFRAAAGIPMDTLSLMSCSGLTALNAITKLQASVGRATKHSGTMAPH